MSLRDFWIFFLLNARIFTENLGKIMIIPMLFRRKPWEELSLGSPPQAGGGVFLIHGRIIKFELDCVAAEVFSS